MSYNFKIGELKENALHTVSTIDKWDGSTKTEEMTGASLKSFTNGCAHLYDIHAEEISEEGETTKRTAESRGVKEGQTVRTFYYVAWSPLYGEATFTSCFADAAERERYISRLGKTRSIRTWEYNYNA